MMMMIILTMLTMMMTISNNDMCKFIFMYMYSQAAMNRELASVDRWLNLHTSSYNLIGEKGEKEIFLYVRICRWWSDIRYVHILFHLSIHIKYTSYITHHIKENMTFRTFIWELFSSNPQTLSFAFFNNAYYNYSYYYYLNKDMEFSVYVYV